MVVERKSEVNNSFSLQLAKRRKCYPLLDKEFIFPSVLLLYLSSHVENTKHTLNSVSFSCPAKKRYLYPCYTVVPCGLNEINMQMLTPGRRLEQPSICIKRQKVREIRRWISKINQWAIQVMCTSLVWGARGPLFASLGNTQSLFNQFDVRLYSIQRQSPLSGGTTSNKGFSRR